MYHASFLTVFGDDLKAKDFSSISDIFLDIVRLIILPSKININNSYSVFFFFSLDIC